MGGARASRSYKTGELGAGQSLGVQLTSMRASTPRALSPGSLQMADNALPSADDLSETAVFNLNDQKYFTS
jgi:hypothetical protein